MQSKKKGKINFAVHVRKKNLLQNIQGRHRSDETETEASATAAADNLVSLVSRLLTMLKLEYIISNDFYHELKNYVLWSNEIPDKKSVKRRTEKHPTDLHVA